MHNQHELPPMPHMVAYHFRPAGQAKPEVVDGREISLPPIRGAFGPGIVACQGSASNAGRYWGHRTRVAPWATEYEIQEISLHAWAVPRPADGPYDELGRLNLRDRRRFKGEYREAVNSLLLCRNAEKALATNPGLVKTVVRTLWPEAKVVLFSIHPEPQSRRMLGAVWIRSPEVELLVEDTNEEQLEFRVPPNDWNGWY